MSESDAVARPDAARPKFSLARVGGLSIPILLVGVLGYQLAMSRLPQPSVQFARATAGMGRPIVNRLADGYADADGDLVADRPSDPTALIDPQELVFSYIPEETTEPRVSRALWSSFTDHLAKVTGRRVVYRIYPDRESQLRAIRAGQLHLAGLNTGNVPFAVNAAGFVPKVSVASEAGQDYTMKIIVPADSTVRSVKDLKGRTLTLTKPSSNSGYKAPLVILSADYGMELHRDFNTNQSFGHEKSIVGVVDGSYEAASVASDLLESVAAARGLDLSRVRAIYTSPPFPKAVIGYAHNLSGEMAEKIEEAIRTFEFNDPQLRRVFAADGGVRFARVNYAEDFAHVRRIDDAFGVEHRLED